MKKSLLSKILSIFAVFLLFFSISIGWFTPSVLAANEKPKFQYAAKVVCSLLTEFPDGPVAQGTYRTLVNIHNPTNKQVTVTTKVAVAQNPNAPPSEASISQFKKYVLESDEAVAIDCATVADFFCPTPSGKCFDFGSLDGYFVVYSPVKLDVDAVYTARESQSQVKTLDVEKVEPQLVDFYPEKQSQSKKQPDLIVKDIDLESLDVDCPGGGGTCVSTAKVTITNIGAGDAGAFNTKINFDPSQIVNQSSPSGLASGASDTFTATTQPNGNCFDPNCTICVKVDDLQQVIESNETNNQRCETKPG